MPKFRLRKGRADLHFADTISSAALHPYLPYLLNTSGSRKADLPKPFTEEASDSDNSGSDSSTSTDVFSLTGGDTAQQESAMQIWKIH